MSHRCSIYICPYIVLSIVARVRERSEHCAAVFEFPITVSLKIYFLQQCILAHFLKRRFTVFL